MDGVIIGVLAGALLSFIAYKYISMRKKKDESGNSPSKGGGNTGNGEVKPTDNRK